jgi:hypothetical protein
LQIAIFLSNFNTIYSGDLEFFRSVKSYLSHSYSSHLSIKFALHKLLKGNFFTDHLGIIGTMYQPDDKLQVTGHFADARFADTHFADAVLPNSISSTSRYAEFRFTDKPFYRQSHFSDNPFRRYTVLLKDNYKW